MIVQLSLKQTNNLHISLTLKMMRSLCIRHLPASLFCRPSLCRGGNISLDVFCRLVLPSAGQKLY